MDSLLVINKREEKGAGLVKVNGDRLSLESTRKTWSVPFFLKTPRTNPELYTIDIDSLRVLKWLI